MPCRPRGGRPLPGPTRRCSRSPYSGRRCRTGTHGSPASDGFGFSSSSARVVSTMPGVQNPHCSPCFVWNACWIGCSSAPSPERLDRLDLRSIGLDGEGDARPDDLPVEDDGARPAHAVLAADVRAGRARARGAGSRRAASRVSAIADLGSPLTVHLDDARLVRRRDAHDRHLPAWQCARPRGARARPPLPSGTRPSRARPTTERTASATARADVGGDGRVVKRSAHENLLSFGNPDRSQPDAEEDEARPRAGTGVVRLGGRGQPHEREVAVTPGDLVEGPPSSRGRAAQPHLGEDLVLVQRGGEERPEQARRRRSRRVPSEPCATTSPPRASRTAGASAAGSACATMPPNVPRFRVAGWPTYRIAFASSGNCSATSGEPRPRPAASARRCRGCRSRP